MAEIHNVGLNLNHKIANPFRTSRNSTTNPFKNVNFEGNTLPFADVFEGFDPTFKGAEAQKISKMKMITSSVVGSMTKLHSSITEPIAKFVSRMKEGYSVAKEHAKQFSEACKTTMNRDIVDIGKDISTSITESISGMGRGISDKAIDLHKGISEKWNGMISKIQITHRPKITKDTPVEELKNMLRNELELAGAL